MGFCHEDHGNVSVETRRESLAIHAVYDWWEGYPHPEFPYEDIPDLIAALEEVRDRWAPDLRPSPPQHQGGSDE